MIPHRTDRPLVFAALGALAAVALGTVVAKPGLLAAPLIRIDEPGRAPIDAVFVLSGDVDFHRTRAGAAAFARLGARWFVVSGAGSGGDSGRLMAEAAIAAGVPRDAIVVEEHARTTRENVAFTAPLLAARGITRVAVVTSPYHSRRAALAAERAWPDIDVVSLPAPLEPYDRPNGEWPKLIAYAFRLWI